MLYANEIIPIQSSLIITNSQVKKREIYNLTDTVLLEVHISITS